MAGRQTITYADYGGEQSVFSVLTEDLTMANFDGQMNLMDQLWSKLFPLTEGLTVQRTRTVFTVGSGEGKASSPTAQREQKWLVIYEDDVTKKVYQVSIPTAELTSGVGGTLLDGPSQQANFASDAWADFIVAFENVVVSENDNTVTILSAKHVGRNL